MKLLNHRPFVMALSLWMSLMALHAANVVTVTGGDGAPGGEVTIEVALRTDAADVAAAEIRIPMPDGIEPAAGGVSLNGSRVPDHSVTADMNGRDYVIVLFNTSLKAIPVGDGKVLSFKVSLGDNPGRFTLTPKVKLSGRRGEAIAAETTDGTLNVLAPRLELGTTNVDFGRVALRSEVVQYVEVRNSGTTTLTFASYTTTGVEGLTAMMPRSLAEGESAMIELHYTPTVRNAGIDGRFTPVSDGVGRSQFVRIQAVPFSVNELHVGSASGVSDEEVSVSVRMNNMEPIAGIDFWMRLPDELDFVEGSVEKAGRASALSVESKIGADRTLRIVMYGVSKKAVTGDDGELFSFRLKLKGRSGYYSLSPSKVILANAAGENMTSQVYDGAVTINSPQLSSSYDWPLGNVALSGDHTFGYGVANYSQVPLTIDRVVFLDDIAECTTPMPLVVEPYGHSEIAIKLKDAKFGRFATTMNIYTNDPDNRMKSVSLSGNFYSPNEMSFSGRYDNGRFLIDASLTNEEDIAALQLDVVCPAGISTDESLLKLADRASGHSATLARVNADRYRVVIFSLKNTPLSGNEGIVFSLGLEGASAAGQQVRIENIKLSSTAGVNITTPDSDVKMGDLPVPASAITLSHSSVTLRVNGELQLSAEISPWNVSSRELKWITSDEKIVTVDSNGLVKAAALGTARIYASTTDGSGVSATCEVTVVPTPAEAINLNRSELSLRITETFKLEATILPETTTDKTVTWKSYNELVATVDQSGNVTAITVGKANITATAASGVSASCEVIVVPIPTESITLSQTTASLKVGESLTLTGTVLPNDATDKTITWTSSNEAVAIVDASGKVTAVTLGEAEITAKCGDVSASCSITVVPTPAESIALNRSELSLKATESFKLESTISPETTTDKTVTWSSSDEAVATVDADGKVTAVAVGEAVITARCGEATATCTVTVVPTSAEAINLNRSELSLKATESFKLEATVSPETTTDKTVTWSSSDEAVATVDADGNVTAVAVGEAVIRVAMRDDSTIYDECRVSVTKEASGITEIISGDAPYEVFNLSGVKVSDSIDGLAPGFYVIRQGSTVNIIAID